jgi:hypothetical protein
LHHPCQGLKETLRTIIIYPTTHELNLAWQYHQHPIHIKTINLNMHWKNIEERLKEIVDDY